MCILDLSKVLMFEFFMITLKIDINALKSQDYYSLTLIVWCMKLKPNIFIKIWVSIKECLALVIIQLGQNFMTIKTN